MFHVEQSKIMTCPNCLQIDSKPLMKVLDQFLTKEEFELHKCRGCGLIRTSPSPDSTEIIKYYASDEYLSHGAQKKGLFAFLYRLAKNYNIGIKGRLLSSLKKNAAFLDYGCGTADLISYCQELGMKVRGAEPSPEAISHSPEHIRSLIVSPDEELTSTRTYDIISMWHVLEHIQEPREILIALISKLNPGGHLVIALPNNNSYDAKHYGAFWAAWDVPRHLWHYSPDQIIPLVESLGMKHRSSHPMWFDAFYVSLLSERYKGGRILSAIVHASISNFKALFNKKRGCSSQIYIFHLK